MMSKKDICTVNNPEKVREECRANGITALSCKRAMARLRESEGLGIRRGRN